MIGVETYYFEFAVICVYENHWNLKIRVKRCTNEAHAKVKLEDYCKRKYPKFERLIIYKSKLESTLSNFDVNEFYKLFNLHN
jgi:hypothetical protein